MILFCFNNDCCSSPNSFLVHAGRLLFMRLYIYVLVAFSFMSSDMNACLILFDNESFASLF